MVSVWAPACQDSIPGSHAGVGVVSMKGAPLTLPTFFTPEFAEFFRLGRAIRVILSLANGIFTHLFVLYGNQGSCDDPHKLALTNKLLEAVIREAKVCGSGQPVVITGDFNVEPSVIPVVAKAMQCSHLVDLEVAFSAGRGEAPSPTCRFDLDGAPGTRRDFSWYALMPLLQVLGVRFWLIAGSGRTMQYVLSLGLGAWSAEVHGVRVSSPLAPACWLDCPDRSRYSLSKPVQEAWKVYLEALQFVPLEVRQRLHWACLGEPNVDVAWGGWSDAAENGSLAAYKSAGGPCPQGDLPYLGRGKAVYRIRLIGGRPPGRVHRPARADPVDCSYCLSFINSSLSPVVLFRRRLSSVGDVLKGIRKSGFSTARWQALMFRWGFGLQAGSHWSGSYLRPLEGLASS